jgi:methylated-DNA-[protein]-cysteine S-methyltransferase
MIPRDATAQGFTVFATPVGACGLAWSERGICGVNLPETSESATRARMHRRFPDAPETAPPPHIVPAVEAIQRLLSGEATDLSQLPLDMTGVPPFHRRVYEAARKIPRGSTATYGEIALQVGTLDSARAVGHALANNPFAVVVPCHRVLAAGGKPGGFSAGGGVNTKVRLLEIEQAAIGGNLPLAF